MLTLKFNTREKKKSRMYEIPECPFQCHTLFIAGIWGYFKKLCYERLSMRKKTIFWIQIRHFIIRPHERSRSKIKIAIPIQNSPSHTHWPIFEGEKEERVDEGGVNFHKKVVLCCKVCQKRDVKQTSDYNT